MGRGVSESVRVPDTSAVKNQGKSWPADMSSILRCVKKYTRSDYYQLAKTMSTFDSEVKWHENLNLGKIKLYLIKTQLTHLRKLSKVRRVSK